MYYCLVNLSHETLQMYISEPYAQRMIPNMCLGPGDRGKVELKEVSRGISICLKQTHRILEGWAKIAFCPQQTVNIKAVETLDECHSACFKDLSMGRKQEGNLIFLLPLFPMSIKSGSEERVCLLIIEKLFEQYLLLLFLLLRIVT